ncbi:MAG: nitrile hydratase accessory protein [Acidobacteriota bacterium]|nr:nitrile hydratase accessory protein [Acidobacteriota bacterium]
MSERIAEADLPIEGPAAPPRSNGELVFEEPWQSRLFGLTLALQEQGVFAWKDFQTELIAAIAEWESRADHQEEYRYYECWQRAFEKMLRDRDLCTAQELDQRSHQLAARPHGHDHDHEH